MSRHCHFGGGLSNKKAVAYYSAVWTFCSFRVPYLFTGNFIKWKLFFTWNVEMVLARLCLFVNAISSKTVLFHLQHFRFIPFAALPFFSICSTSVFFHIKFGADGLDVSTMQKNIKTFVLLLPLIGLPFMCQFPAVRDPTFFGLGLVLLCFKVLLWSHA